MLKSTLTTSALLLVLAGPAFAQADKPAEPATPPAAQTESTTSPAATTETAAPPAATTETTTSPAATTESTATTDADKTTAGSGDTGATSATVIEEQKSDEIRADDLIGTTVKNEQDEDIGKISDLILDKESKVTGVVVSVGGFLGIGSKQVAIPYDGLQVRSSESGEPDEVVVSWSKEELEAAPEYKTLADKKAEQDRAAPAAGGGMGAGGAGTGGAGGGMGR